MELKAHFANIHEVILGHLELAQTEIVAAVAWFTDRELFEMLRKKVRVGIKVSVVLIADEINQGPRGLNFSLLRNLGGHVVFLPEASGSEPTMHHKFCVIDGSTVITGSYNWSNKARSNDENITVISGDVDFASKYVDAFASLVARAGAKSGREDVNGAKRRLEVIRNLVLLGEQEDLALHLRKLRPAADSLRLSEIISALDNGEYQVAIEEIDIYLQRLTALVSTELVDAPRLRLQLTTLELRLESLADEKAELERRLIIFNRRHDEVLGDVIQRLLKARADLAWLVAAATSHSGDRSKQKEAEAEAESATNAYEEYTRDHDRLEASPLPVLDEASERDLKAIYRKACGLCHPDKFPDGMKEAAHRVFVELQEAYKRNDLAKVRELHKVLAAGGLPGIRSNTLSKVEALAAAIAEMEFAISRQVKELKALYESEAVKMMSLAGEEGEGWTRFFAQQKSTLEAELEKIISRTSELQKRVALA